MTRLYTFHFWSHKLSDDVLPAELWAASIVWLSFISLYVALMPWVTFSLYGVENVFPQLLCWKLNPWKQCTLCTVCSFSLRPAQALFQTPMCIPQRQNRLSPLSMRYLRISLLPASTAWCSSVQPAGSCSRMSAACWWSSISCTTTQTFQCQFHQVKAEEELKKSNTPWTGNELWDSEHISKDYRFVITCRQFTDSLCSGLQSWCSWSTLHLKKTENKIQHRLIRKNSIHSTPRCETRTWAHRSVNTLWLAVSSS